MSKAKLIVASARLPVTMAKRADGWTVHASTGGLVTALKSVSDQRPFTWLGWPGTHVTEADRGAVTKELSRHGSAPVFIAKSDISGFYEGFSNQVLWPLFHALNERIHFDRSAWRAYQKVNEQFADAILDQAGPGDVVWVHDYQLALVPELLRRRGLACPIGFFLHIPFPAAQTYRSLAVREEILTGLLGADLLGFHSYEYVSHFRAACLRVLGLESEPNSLRLSSHRVKLGMLPIGIDPGEVSDLCQTEEAKSELARLTETYRRKQIVVGVDRLDYTKGIPEKLRAFEELLARHPKLRDKAVLIQIAAPSRMGVQEYQSLKREVDELVGRVNGRFGSASHTPVVYVNQAYSRARLAGLYQAADVALVTPIRDGMNLVALEYVAARREQGGTLILSEFAGAAHCLPGARLVNPYNVDQVAHELAHALEGRAARTKQQQAFGNMLDFVDNNTSMRWAQRFLDQLESGTEGARTTFKRLRVDAEPLASKFRAATNPLMLLDYDGTLRGFVNDPMSATPEPRILETLEKLSQLCTLYVISGRPAAVLEEWLGSLPIGLVCEHGLGVKPIGGEWHDREQPSIESLKKVIDPLFKDFVSRTPGSRVEYKRGGIAWHYRAADPEFGAFQANELLTLLADVLKRRPFNVLKGNRVIEVRHEQATKGRATSELLRRHAKADFLFCAGDDRTDEEMMDAIPKSWAGRAVTCWVGSANSRAQFWVESNHALLAELERVAATWEGERRKAKKSR
ncbi:MAG: bifunctional alpha,alpha-trehalose-phosphate synthase (UDP-forming)/trehalose-phosphatase [Polyangiaceae bacterium]